MPWLNPGAKERQGDFLENATNISASRMAGLNGSILSLIPSLAASPERRPPTVPRRRNTGPRQRRQAVLHESSSFTDPLLAGRLLAPFPRFATPAKGACPPTKICDWLPNSCAWCYGYEGQPPTPKLLLAFFHTNHPLRALDWSSNHG